MSEPLSIGSAIRKLRNQRRITGERMAQLAGLSQSKISKIETGHYPNVKPEEVERLLHVLEAPKALRQQIQAQLENPLRTKYTLRRYNARYPLGRLLELERKTAFVRVFVITGPPVLLQTLEYREAWLKTMELGREDFLQALKETTKRHDFLWDGNHKFHFILHETALYTRPGSRNVQLAQLDRLKRFIGVAQIKIGIVPTTAGLPPVENGGFSLYGQRYLFKMIANADIESEDSVDIAEHTKIFGQLDQRALYGDEARRLIGRAEGFFGSN